MNLLVYPRWTLTQMILFPLFKQKRLKLILTDLEIVNFKKLPNSKTFWLPEILCENSPIVKLKGKVAQSCPSLCNPCVRKHLTGGLLCAVLDLYWILCPLIPEYSGTKWRSKLLPGLGGGVVLKYAYISIWW